MTERDLGKADFFPLPEIIPSLALTMRKKFFKSFTKSKELAPLLMNQMSSSQLALCLPLLSTLFSSYREPISEAFKFELFDALKERKKKKTENYLTFL